MNGHSPLCVEASLNPKVLADVEIDRSRDSGPPSRRPGFGPAAKSNAFTAGTAASVAGGHRCGAEGFRIGVALGFVPGISRPDRELNKRRRYQS